MTVHRDCKMLRRGAGGARSHGCIRISDAGVSWLAQRIPPGTPVDVRP